MSAISPINSPFKKKKKNHKNLMGKKKKKGIKWKRLREKVLKFSNEDEVTCPQLFEVQWLRVSLMRDDYIPPAPHPVKGDLRPPPGYSWLTIMQGRPGNNHIFPVLMRYVDFPDLSGLKQALSNKLAPLNSFIAIGMGEVSFCREAGLWQSLRQRIYKEMISSFC